MNVHKSRKVKKGTTLKLYPLGIISKPFTFSDILSKEYGHVACIISRSDEECLENNIKKECVIWDKDGFPDVYIKEKLITFDAMKKGLKLLEKDPKNKFKYVLIRKNYFDLK